MTEVNQNTLTVEQFDAYVTKLRTHDWYYEYSDDHSVWSQGSRESGAINAGAASHPVLKQAYLAYEHYRCDPKLNIREELNQLRSSLS